MIYKLPRWSVSILCCLALLDLAWPARVNLRQVKRGLMDDLLTGRVRVVGS